jgi:ArsR family transcriptional regulator
MALAPNRSRPPQAVSALEMAARNERMARLFHALSDPTRLRICAALRQGEQCVCNLMDVLDAQQSRLSFHLKTLKDAGLVQDRRDGRWVHYSLDPKALEEVRVLLENLAEAARTSAAACCRR